MTTTDITALPDYLILKDILDNERKAIIKVNNFTGEDDDYVRSVEDAAVLIDFLKDIQTELWECFRSNPSLMAFFDQEFLPFNEFIQRSYIFDTVFLDDCLIPEKEAFFFGQDGAVSASILDLHRKAIHDWIEKKRTAHEATQKQILENFSFELKLTELACQCQACEADYRNQLREFIFLRGQTFINEAKEKLNEAFDTGTNDPSEIYADMQKSLDKLFYSVRFRLKRSSLNRLESQIKSLLREQFTQPAPLAIKREQALIPYLRGQLVDEEGHRDDFLTEMEYSRFFSQLGTSLWKGEKFLAREFTKLVKSIAFLKRKDISGKILQDYLGEFWIHSEARTIKRKIIYHMGPTNSGKTYHAIEGLSKVKRGCYLAPLRLLAAELYDTLNQKGVITTLLTGEEVIEVEGATHYASTIEMARLREYFDCCVIDEIQMITDPQRGWAWTRALVNIFADEVHLCGDASALDLVKVIVELCGDVLEIRNYERMTSLEVEDAPISLGEMEKSDALIVFSRRNALRYKADLERFGFKVSIVYGRLSPEVRREQARKFDKGETDIMVATDAISMGMNLPIRRIVFTTLTKYIDNQEIPITPSEIKQIAGRAGRFQRFPNGYVSCLTKCEDGLSQIQDALDTTLEQQEKCMVGPDLDIFSQVNQALEDNGLQRLKLSEFLRLFNTMNFKKPFFCVDLKEMIELAEMVEDADPQGRLSSAEIFGYACAPVNLGLMEHVQYYIWILNNYVNANLIKNEPIDFRSTDIDYLETSIKCVELYQWLSRHFNNKHFEFDEADLLNNKAGAIEQLNTLLSDKIVPTCSSCGAKLPDKSRFPICDDCFRAKRFSHGRRQTFMPGKPGQTNGDQKGGGRRPDGPRRGPPGRGGPSRPGAPAGASAGGEGRRPRSKKRRSNGRR